VASQFGLPIPVPPIAPELEQFWKATTQGQLLVPQCDRCGLRIWYPRPYCPDCGSLDITWIVASGFGRVHSYTLDYRARGRSSRSDGSVPPPIVIAYVELDEGPRVATNIVGCDPQSVFIGQHVRAIFDEVDETAALIRFCPTEPSSGGSS
jgi:uncharacterized protein